MRLGKLHIMFLDHSFLPTISSISPNSTLCPPNLPDLPFFIRRLFQSRHSRLLSLTDFLSLICQVFLSLKCRCGVKVLIGGGHPVVSWSPVLGSCISCNDLCVCNDTKRCVLHESCMRICGYEDKCLQ